MQERSERKVLSRWPNNLLRKVKHLKKSNQMDLLPDMRTSLILSGIEDQLPENLGLDIVDHEQSPYLSRHIMSHASSFR